MATRKRTALGRRTLLRTIGTGSTAAMALSALAATPRDAQAYDPGRQEMRSRYRADSADVEAFYRTNRYETLKKGQG